jgi:DNA-binding HxlR family transcriptional regulator
MDSLSTVRTREAAVEVRSIERAIDILQCLSQARGPMSVGELQKAIGLSRPTLYRILQTLEKRDLIVSSGEPLKFALHVIRRANPRRTPRVPG